MKMFLVIFRYELQQGFREPVHLVYGLLLLGLAVLGMGSLAEAFDEHSVGAAAGLVNTPWEINKMALLLGQLLAFAVAYASGQAIWRDHKSGLYHLLYTYPFGVSSYLWGKWLSGLLLSLGLGALVLWGFYLGLQLPTANGDLVGAFVWETYLHTYVVYLLPNICLLSAVAFGASVLSRQLHAAYLAVLLLLLIQWVGGSVLHQTDSQWMSALLDPWGERAAAYATRYWSSGDYATQQLPLAEVVVYNRLLWLGVAASVQVYVWRRFRFDQERGTAAREVWAEPGHPPVSGLTAVPMDYSVKQRAAAVWAMARHELRYILGSRLFVGVVVLGFVAVLLQQAQLQPAYGLKLLPLTWRLLQVPYLVFSGFIYFLTFLYAGHLLERARLARMDAWLDLCPLPDGAFWLAHWLALVLMQALLLALLLIGGITAQLAQGYYSLALDQYLWVLYALRWPEWAVWAAAALFVQSLLGHAYLGLFVLVLLAFGVTALPDLGIETLVFRFNQGPAFVYSDLTGYAGTLLPYGCYKVYWGFAALILLLLTHLLWVRGAEQSLGLRWQQARRRLTGPIALALAISTLSMLGLGSWLYTHDDTEATQTEDRRWMAESERRYKKYAPLPQPRIVAVELKLDLYTHTRSFQSKGSYLLVNKTARTIDTLLVHYGYPGSTRIWLSRAVRTHEVDSLIRYHLIGLAEGLAPGDSLRLYFALSSEAPGPLEASGDVGEDFAYIRHSRFPGLGYRAVELTNAQHRQMYGLNAHPTAMPMPGDSLAGLQHYYRQDADDIRLDALLSVDEGLKAIAPGTLQREWHRQGRHYFHYRTTSDIRCSFAFLAGRWTQTRYHWGEVALDIYHHPKHTHNLESLSQGWAAAMAFSSSHFGASQHKQYSLVEYPLQMGTEATLFANVMPLAETYFLIDQDKNPPEGINFPFYVSAHETAHHWWGNQLIPARAAGAKMLTESLAEYVALRSLEQAFGKEALRRGIALNASLYLKDHQNPEAQERPLIESVADQDFVNYRKGSLAFYTLYAYTGGQLDQWLQQFLHQHSTHHGAYPRSTDLLRHLSEATPDSLQYLIHDFFEAIVLYDNSLKANQLSRLPDGRYQLEIHFWAIKYGYREYDQRYYGSQALVYQPDPAKPAIRSLPLADYLEIAIFAEDGTELYLKKHRVKEISNRIVLILDQKPASVSIDPHHQWIDIKPHDNHSQINAHVE